MSKSISATDVKNNFGGLLEDVSALGRFDIVRHGRLVAVVPSPQALNCALAASGAADQGAAWGQKHMIPAELARAARMLDRPSGFDTE